MKNNQCVSTKTNSKKINVNIINSCNLNFYVQNLSSRFCAIVCVEGGGVTRHVNHLHWFFSEKREAELK